MAATFNIPATGSGTIYVNTIVKEANGYFKETISVIILTNCLDNPTLNRQFKENSIKNVFISPNPTQGDFVTLITGFKDKSVKINLIDAKSSSIISTLDKNIDSDEYNQDFDTPNLTNGLYFLQLISGEIIITKKIIIAHD